ncbi:OmpL47-type beta-barrel domain-containing protein [Micromonospora sp. NPDC007230]|uniref:OmpL47-type beta-barrel domain-containing protein n=1 Tax=Micromonospora sp. NPDC007230 TaxID=3364237 RepID=UPI00368BF6F6
MVRRFSAAIALGALVVPGALAVEPAYANESVAGRVDLAVGLSDHINLAGTGLVPAVVRSTPTFDATAVDAGSVRLGASGVSGASPAKWADGAVMATKRDADGDGRTDLVLHFDKADLASSGGLGPDSTELNLSGRMSDGREITGSDQVDTEVAFEIKFAESLAIRGANAGLHSARGQSLGRVESVLDRHGQVRDLVPMVQSVSSAELTELAGEAEERTGGEVPDMSSWYRLTMPSGVDAEAVMAELTALPEVAHVYPVPEPVPPPSTTPDFTGRQGYLRPAPTGIDADFSRRDPRLRGAGIKVADLEYDWNPFHEDLQLDWSSDLGGDAFPRYTGFADEHGTAVFGIMAGRDNEYGVTGGVPDAQFYGISPNERLPSGRTSWNPGPALVYLAANGGLRPGDVVLLEQQTSSPLGGTRYAPLEWIPAVFDAIKLLTGLGVTVVSTGGNGNTNSDDPMYTRNGIRWFDPAVQHSGSIMVGAGSSTDHERLSFSNYGTRFDLQGWGQNITTTGSNGNLQGGTNPADLNVRYTQSFGGTSGAGPIVTNAVVAIQSYLKATGQAPWTAQQIVEVLRATGTPQGANTAGQQVGPLPNLEAALKTIEVDAPVSAIALSHHANSDVDPVANPLVTLNADDGWGVGVARVEYRIDGGPWTEYQAPFRVKGPGQRTIEYRATDNKGNVEKANTLTFNNPQVPVYQ